METPSICPYIDMIYTKLYHVPEAAFIVALKNLEARLYVRSLDTMHFLLRSLWS